MVRTDGMGRGTIVLKFQVPPVGFLLDEAHHNLQIIASVGRDAANYKKMAEGRKKGQVDGKEANRLNAERRGAVIDRLAIDLWRQKPHLRNKWSATAREIVAMKHPALRKKRPHDFIGEDTIRRRLSKSNARGVFREIP